MDLEKLIKALCRIFRSAIRRFSRLSAPAVDNTIPNGTAQPGADALPENKLVKPDREPPAPRPTAEKPEDPKNLSNHQDTPREKAAPANRTHNKPAETPQIRSGARSQGKRVVRQPKVATPEAKPELICQEVRSHNHWQIFLTLPQDQKASVSQGETGLSPNNDGKYPLLNFSKTLTVNVTENAQNETIKLTDGKSLLIFKLRKNWKGCGRKVRHVSNGYYVVFAPRTWYRKGEAPVEPSGSADSEFSAHYFFSDGNGEPDGFDECSSFFQQRRFSLEGETVVDDSDMGDLFVGTPPELIDATGNNWHGISWIRVGEEGSGKWSENFKPTEKNLATVLGN